MATRRDFTTLAALSALTAGLAPGQALAATLSPTASPANPDLDAFYRRYIAALNTRDLAAIAAMLPPKVMRLGTSYPRQGVIDSFKVITDAVPDYQWAIQDLFVEGDRIAARLQNTGTPVKPFLGHAATGRPVKFMEFASYRISGGRFAEMWFLVDEPTVAKQLKGEG